MLSETKRSAGGRPREDALTEDASVGRVNLRNEIASMALPVEGSRFQMNPEFAVRENSD